MNKLSFCSALLLSLPALAQPAPPSTSSQNPTAPSPPAAATTGTSSSTSMGATMNATVFAELAAASDAFGIAAGRLAMEKASSSDVKAFARGMVEEHSRLAQGFRAALRTANAAVNLPAQVVLDAKREAVLEQLRSASERDFDRVYTQAQALNLEEALVFTRTYAESGDDPALKRFAGETAPTIEGHLQRARGLPA